MHLIQIAQTFLKSSKNGHAFDCSEFWHAVLVHEQPFQRSLCNETTSEHGYFYLTSNSNYPALTPFSVVQSGTSKSVLPALFVANHQSNVINLEFYSVQRGKRGGATLRRAECWAWRSVIHQTPIKARLEAMAGFQFSSTEDSHWYGLGGCNTNQLQTSQF